MVKPVDLAELEARLRALLRRATDHADNRLSCGTLILDRADQMVWCADEVVDLSAYEFVVLEALLEHQGECARMGVCDEGPAFPMTSSCACSPLSSVVVARARG
ncbi:MAG: hypothetical protein U5L98_03675 [Halomonas sp.]|uniref:hypothetical protein n=1 Tax=Halomonas sp. TaxID=1486246 RepID=UPI002ACDB44C|nr:hypothetical protein [Halomonas sp.]MDZ7851761.1 hypothetical protein [Halomonas sp.]